jgi:hypothetical protein
MSDDYDMTAPEMTRVTVRVPKATLDQIDRWVESLGVRRSHFLGIALVAGSRLLVRTCIPEALTAQGEAHVGDEVARTGSQAAGDDAEAPLTLRLEVMQAEIVALRAEVAELQDELARGGSPDPQPANST